MTGQTQALIFANGRLAAGPLLRQTRAEMPQALVIAADGGARLARSCGLVVDVVIGDMDSIDAQTLEELEEAGAQLLRHSPDKDETDLELALKWVVDQGIRSLRIFGALGGRLDQALASVSLLALPELEDCDVQLLDGRSAGLVAAPGRARSNRLDWRHDLPAAPARPGGAAS